MFENVTKATDLENRLRYLWQRHSALHAEQQWRHVRGARYTQQQIHWIGDEIDQLLISWEAATGKRWHISYFNNPAPDDVMEAAFARLADELEAQAAAELEKRETLLFHMLSHTTHFLERFLKRQEARDTPQSLEAAEYIKRELETARAWRDELREAK